MPVRVVHLFKFVEVNEHDRERTSRARGTFPFGAEGFPEKAPSLDAGKTVGNRLLLQFLEHEGIVQRSRQQVSEGVQQQEVLRGKSVLRAALDVERPEQGFTVRDWNAQHRSRIGEDSQQVGLTA